MWGSYCIVGHGFTFVQGECIFPTLQQAPVGCGGPAPAVSDFNLLADFRSSLLSRDVPENVYQPKTIQVVVMVL